MVHPVVNNQAWAKAGNPWPFVGYMDMGLLSLFVAEWSIGGAIGKHIYIDVEKAIEVNLLHMS